MAQRCQKYTLYEKTLQINVVDGQFLFEAFSHIIPIFGSIKPQTESSFPFQYKIIFETHQSLEPYSSTPDLLFCTNSQFSTTFS